MILRTLLLLSLLFIANIGIAQIEHASIYFNVNSSYPDSISKLQLKQLKKEINNNEIKLLTINAYTDSSGTQVINDTLSRRRLNYVVRYFDIANDSTITKNSFGTKRPMGTITYQNWRRVDVFYQKTTELKDTNKIETDTSTLQKSELQLQLDSLNSSNIDSIFRLTDKEKPFILSVSFFGGRAKMKSESIPQIELLYQYMVKYPKTVILIRGHVCCGKNMRISRNRAKKVYKELHKMGIAKSRLNFKGMSNSEPLVFPEKTEMDRQMNRRVDILFLQR